MGCCGIINDIKIFAGSSMPVLPLVRDFRKRSVLHLCAAMFVYFNVRICEVELKEFVMTLVQLPVSMRRFFHTRYRCHKAV